MPARNHEGESAPRLSHCSRAAWSIERHGTGYALYSGRGPMQHGMNLVYLSEPDSNWEATKRLIEQAPAMLDALREVIAALDKSPTHGGYTARPIAAEAIKKATGEVV